MTLPDYVTPDMVQAYAPTNEASASTVWDAVVTSLCTNCSRAFDTLTFREPGAYAVTDDTTRYFNGVPCTATDFITLLSTGEYVDLTSVNIAPNGGNSYTPLDASNFWLWPYNAAAEGKPYTQIELNTQNGSVYLWPSRPHSVQVVGKFGYSATVPADIQEAMLLYIMRMLRKTQQNYEDVGQMLNSGVILVGMKQDYDLQSLILMYRKARLA